MNRISRALQTGWNSLRQPQSFEKGTAFEDFVENEIFDETQYQIIHKTNSYATNSRRFVESSLLPDFLFRDKVTGREFYVECKFRCTLNPEGNYEWCNDQQLERYLQLHQEVPVFVALGLEGVPEKPGAIFLIPLHYCSYTSLFPSRLSEYELFYIPLSPNYLWSRL